ncbi:MAG: peptidase [Rhodospirillales bacterium]|nr:peptidase [Rhodospirillales bacterium]
MKVKILFRAGVISALLATVPNLAMAADAKAVAATYANVAHAMYEDALITAGDLRAAVAKMIATPTDATLSGARSAWVRARAPYQQTEGLRFGNALVDDWEGKVNSWPLDEGLIDYVSSAYGSTSDANPAYTLNVIANSKLRIGASVVDASVIDKALLSGALHEALEVESNVATGYHAIEFLLWGQDLNGTGPGAGNRPASDFDLKNCSGGNCDRRAAYLTAATDLLVDDIKEMVIAWAPGGDARAAVMGKSEDQILATILTGLGSLSYGELAGERIKLGLILHDPEEEHDCFSDNTHNSHYYDQVGMIALYTGTYKRINGTVVKGPSLADVAAAKAADIKADVDAAMNATLAKMQIMKDTADSGRMAYDQMIGEGQTEGNKIIQDVVDALVAQTRSFEKLVAALNLKINVEGSDSLDNPSSIQ